MKNVDLKNRIINKAHKFIRLRKPLFLKPLVRRMLNSLITKGKKKWNTSLGKWQTDYIIIKTIKLSKYEIARGYPETKYIVDKWYKLSFVG